MFAPHSISVYRPSYRIEMVGNPLANLPDTALKTFKGFMQPASSTTKQVYLQDNINVTHTCYTFSNPALQVDDILKFNDRYFWITGVRNACELDEAWSIDCEEYYGTRKV